MRRKFGKHGFYHYDSKHKTKRSARSRMNRLTTTSYKGQLWRARMTKDENDNYVVWVKRK